MTKREKGKQTASPRGLGVGVTDAERSQGTSPIRRAASSGKKKPWEKLWSIDYSTENRSR